MAGAPTLDFRSILSKPAGSVEKPKPFPIGTYSAMTLGFEPTESTEKKTPGVKVNFQLLSPGDDVDMEEFETAGGQAALSKRKLSTTYWLTEDSLWRLKEFLEVHCGISLDGDKTFAEVLPEITNVQVQLKLKQRIGKNTEVYMEIEEVMAA